MDEMSDREAKIFVYSIFIISTIVVCTLFLGVGHMCEEIDRTIPVKPYHVCEMQFASVEESDRFVSSWLDFIRTYPSYAYAFSDGVSEISYYTYDEPIVDYVVGETYNVTIDYRGYPVLYKCNLASMNIE